MTVGLKLWSVNDGVYLREAKRLYEEGVFDYIELFVVPGTLDRLSAWREVEIPFVLHHAHSVAGFNPARAEAFAANERIAAETHDYAKALRPKFIIFHGGTDGDVREAARQLAFFRERFFADWDVLVENKPLRPLPNKMGMVECRGATEDELETLVAAVGGGFCLDFGHAVASANSQGLEPFAFIRRLRDRFRPRMFHLSDVRDAASEFDSHLHLGTGQFDIAWIVREVLPPDARVSIETAKDSPDNLDDFRRDVEWLADARCNFLTPRIDG